MSIQPRGSRGDGGVVPAGGGPEVAHEARPAVQPDADPDPRAAAQDDRLPGQELQDAGGGAEGGGRVLAWHDNSIKSLFGRVGRISNLTVPTITPWRAVSFSNGDGVVVEMAFLCLWANFFGQFSCAWGGN